MNQKLGELHNTLTQNFSNYKTMLAVGSIATGDKLVEGRSDNDIVLIFDGEYSQHFNDLERILGKFKFDDSYLFTPLSVNECHEPRNKTHAFSHKYRSKILFGQETTSAELPSKEEGTKMYCDGLNQVYWRMSKRIINTPFWSEEKTRTVFWKFFKHAFMYLAIKSYYVNNYYPSTRKKVAEHYKSETLEKTLNTLENINTTSKEQIVETAKELKQYLTEQIREKTQK